jgi:TatD DNase family protein
MHCFSGSIDDARRALEIGFYISLAGILTFPRAGALRDVAAFVPADRVLVETDAPFLAPVPYRGKRNEPAWVAETVRQLATLRSQALDDTRARVAANFAAFIGRRVDTPAKPMV